MFSSRNWDVGKDLFYFFRGRFSSARSLAEEGHFFQAQILAPSYPRLFFFSLGYCCPCHTDVKVSFGLNNLNRERAEGGADKPNQRCAFFFFFLVLELKNKKGVHLPKQQGSPPHYGCVHDRLQYINRREYGDAIFFRFVMDRQGFPLVGSPQSVANHTKRGRRKGAFCQGSSSQVAGNPRPIKRVKRSQPAKKKKWRKK